MSASKRLLFGLSLVELRAGLHLFVLSAFAIAQPLFAIFRQSPEFFVARRVGTGDLVALTALLLLAPPALALVCVRVVGALRPAWSPRVQRFFIGAFGGLAALTVLGRLWSVVALALALGVGVALARTYRPSSKLGAFLSLGAPAPALFAGIFLLTGPISTLVLGGSAPVVHLGQPQATNPVVFVVFDELPVVSLLDEQGDINAQRFPNLASLSERATWFPINASVHPFTSRALPALLSGSLPSEDASPTSTSYRLNLFTVLGASYKVHALEIVSQLCPETLCPPPARNRDSHLRTVGSLMAVSTSVYTKAALPKSVGSSSRDKRADPFGEFLAGAEQGGSEPAASTGGGAAEELHRSTAFRRFIEALRPGDRQLYFAHVLLPHAPSEYLPSGTRYPVAPREGLFGEHWTSEEPWFAQFDRQRHLLQLRHVDQLIGELVGRLDELGMFDETLLVITADHGASFEPGGAHRMLTEDNKYDIGLVPLVIKAPFQALGEVHSQPVRSIDVLPTIFGLLDSELSFPADGHDALAPDSTAWPLRIWDTTERAWVDLDDAPAALDQAARRLAQQFGDGTSAYDLHDQGPHGDLVGRHAPDLPVEGDFGFVASVPDVHAFDLVALEAGVVPAVVGALLPGPVPPDTYVAVAVNGTVGAVVPTYVAPGGMRFVALLPELLFVDGTNRLELFAVLGSESERRFLNIPYVPGGLPPRTEDPRPSEMV